MFFSPKWPESLLIAVQVWFNSLWGVYVLFVSLKQQQKTPKAMQGRLYSRKDLDHEWPECLCLFYAKMTHLHPKKFFSLARVREAFGPDP